MKLRWILLGGTLLFALPKTRKILLNLLSDFIEPGNKKGESEAA